MSESSHENNNLKDLSTLFSSLVSNPEIMSTMGNIISNLSANQNDVTPPLNDNFQGNNENSNENNENNIVNNEENSPTFQNFDPSDILSKIPNILSNFSSTKAEDSIATKQQIALLLAIRPYLSERRKELIDTFIKMSKLGAIFKNLT